MPQLPLSRQTKTEILEEYNKLLEKYDELKMTSKVLSEPQNMELLEKVRDYTVDNLTKSTADLKNNLNTTLNELSGKLFSEAQKFGEIQKAIELSKKNLELNYNIQIAAETLTNLIEDYGKKKTELTEETENKRRDWSREQEEYEYNVKLQRKRGDELYREERIKQEKELEERENILENREKEFIEMKKQVEEFPQKLDKLVLQKEKEIEKHFETEFQRKAELIKKDWDSQKNIYEMKLDNLEEYVKRQNSEITSLKQDTERANKKAQELAVKLIESSASLPYKKEEQKTPQTGQ